MHFTICKLNYTQTTFYIYGFKEFSLSGGKCFKIVIVKALLWAQFYNNKNITYVSIHNAKNKNWVRVKQNTDGGFLYEAKL